MGLWTDAELASGFIISCLPVIPKFFQHIWPKVSRTLSVMSTYWKDSGIASAPVVPAEEIQGNSKLKLPNIKNTLASVFSHTETEDNQTQLEGEYAILSEEIGVPRRDAVRELSQMPAARLGTTRDDLEKGYPRTKFTETRSLA